jgi:predicted TIM-barrel fold metal-dependent hydrolase
MIEFIFAGVFDRFPKLDVVFAEVDFGWVPYVKEQIDNNYQRLDAVSDFGLKEMPGDYIDRHFHFGYMTDSVGLHNLHMMNPERVLWSSDYPHISADYPNSWRTIQASMIGVSRKDRDLICHGNADRLYKLKPAGAAKRPIKQAAE